MTDRRKSVSSILMSRAEFENESNLNPSSFERKQYNQYKTEQHTLH